MSTPSAPDQPSSSLPGEFLTRWLTVRRPARLVADGLVVLALGGLFYIGWTLLYQSNSPAAFEPTALQRNLGVLLSSGFVACWYLGLTLIAFGCVRQIADALASRANTD
ncbi:MAG: hypothetical protein K2Q20_03305 [Phycisphaerales bacterium]|nr:hypothetical protein [Phycisphaerales bacterium]